LTSVKDTLRVLVTRACNLTCPYCCNNIPHVNDRFEQLPWGQVYDLAPVFHKLCISGGEPLLELRRVFSLLAHTRHRQEVYMYTNGVYLNRQLMFDLLMHGVTGINIGIHPLHPLDLDERILAHPQVRLHIIEEFAKQVPLAYYQAKGQVKLVKLNDCDTPNEHIVVAY